MQKYLIMPGKMIQSCRKVIDYIHNKEIPLQSVNNSQELLNRLDEQSIIEIDRSGGIMTLFEFLKACVNYYLVYNQSLVPMNSISLMPSITEKKMADFDEAVEISRDILKKSCKNITPPRSRFKVFTEPKYTSSQSPIISKSESTKSIHIKDSFEIALEEKFKDFLRPHTLEVLNTITSRIQLIDDFEKEIRDEIRMKFLPRVVENRIFEEELRKSKCD